MVPSVAPRRKGDCGVVGMLELIDVSRRFGGSLAVDRISLSVPPGSIAGLIGPNGAGKTTLFNLIAGTLPLSAGRIVFEGRRLEHEPAHRRIARGIGRTFQIPRPFAAMTVLENVLVAAQGQSGERVLANWLRPAVVAAEERRNQERARGIIALLALERLAQQPARVLSGGQRKLLELARVLMAEPRLVLLDEPAAGVNPALLETIMERIETLNANGMTFLIVEHNLSLVRRLCRHVTVMAQGGALASGTPKDVTADPRVTEAYLGGAPA